jgi:hypothetical protein
MCIAVNIQRINNVCLLDPGRQQQWPLLMDQAKWNMAKSRQIAINFIHCNFDNSTLRSDEVFRANRIPALLRVEARDHLSAQL